ncbi:phosphoserine phosphatase SerB [Roseospirillum parvum]|uniref:Phosphoserine phosphatase n=1 Tax=Roseospirillum parvum TaxID=83401 RepID=A0A1G8E560_9PROT|nr:phosphoserine phosphatase SerB [Roseospirillum parvum]SDH65076.1 phosphoserine phosphatase [Roseospirillum parvum]
MDSMLTLIAAPGGLDPAMVDQARRALKATSVQVGSPDWLAEGEACDLPLFETEPDMAQSVAAKALAGAPVDVVCQPVEGRRKALLVADMDSTMVTSETLDDLAARVGLKDEIAAVTARAMAGELDFAEALRARIARLAGLPESAIAETLTEVEITPGGATLIATMKANGAHCLLVSGGFTQFTGAVAARLGFDGHQANRLEIENGQLTGRVAEPILDRHSKLKALMTAAGELRLPMARTLAVGDGANDLDMLRAAGLGVAFRARPVVAETARARIDHGDLTALLYLQGYRKDAFA